MERNKFTDIQERWLKALESGEYRQTVGQLHYEGAYCCLGVAVLVADPEFLKRRAGCLSDRAQQAIGMRSISGGIHPSAPQLNRCEKLSTANDKGSSFAEIAAYIRKHPWAVFTNFDKPGDAEVAA